MEFLLYCSLGSNVPLGWGGRSARHRNYGGERGGSDEQSHRHLEEG